MELTEEQLESLEAFAGALMSLPEIAAVMEIDLEILKRELDNANSPITKAHQKAYLMTKFKVNQKIIDLANSGSSPTQTMAMTLIIEKQIADGT